MGFLDTMTDAWHEGRKHDSSFETKMRKAQRQDDEFAKQYGELRNLLIAKGARFQELENRPDEEQAQVVNWNDIRYFTPSVSGNCYFADNMMYNPQNQRHPGGILFIGNQPISWLGDDGQASPPGSGQLTFTPEEIPQIQNYLKEQCKKLSAERSSSSGVTSSATNSSAQQISTGTSIYGNPVASKGIPLIAKLGIAALVLLALIYGCSQLF